MPPAISSVENFIPSSTIAFPSGEASSAAKRVFRSAIYYPALLVSRSRTGLHFLMCILDGFGLGLEWPHN
jgi:hypothetical protein